MGAWPWYIATTALLALAMLLVLQLIADWARHRDHRATMVRSYWVGLRQ
ncbi:MAG: hypothetical protein JO321_16460 [Solirubrobacterales bacterium]|nr:hypothetical protein [Solirubrobacterales bacterium]